MLAEIPPELISRIALYLALSQPLSPHTTPPVPLLLSCKTIYEAIAPRHNARLYARVYRTFFDVQAAERRFGLGVTERKGPWAVASASASAVQQRAGEKLRAQGLMAELKRRLVALERLRRFVQEKDVLDVRDEDLWVLYFMLIENDGKNAKLLFGPRAVLHLPTFLELYHQQHLVVTAAAPGFPEETVGRSLAVWITWLVFGSGPSDETPEQREERQFVLRPYVFATPRYDAYFAPWTLPSLPSRTLVPVDDHTNNPFVADLVPRSRLVELEVYGRKVGLCPPFISQAAILRFFYQSLEDDDGDGDDERESDGEWQGQEGVVPPFGAFGVGTVDSDAGASSNFLPQSRLRSPPPPQHSSFISSSSLHDRDFLRLSTCYDPTTTPGMPRAVWKGCWEGCWEGSFSFFDFEAFREMLSGQTRALYEGPYGEQAHIWKLKETWVRRKREGKGKGKEKEVQKEADEPLPVNGPMLNAGFPVDQVSPSFNNNNQETFATTEAATLYESIQQQLEALEGYEQVSDDELDEIMAEDDGGEAAGLELLLTGTGHSAWGNFLLKGRVRAWDGMASLVKEYAPDTRGKWIYRGYVLAGDVFVGRWRDTYTPEEYVGYEGNFIFNRR